MKKSPIANSKFIPYDLLLAPLVVIGCYYLVVFQLQHSEKTRNERSVSRISEKLVPLEALVAPENPQSLYSERRPRVVMQPMSFAAGRTDNFTNSAPSHSYSNETYQSLDHNKIHLVSETPVSTFSIDVDGGGFANIRRLLNSGILPNRDQVRTEEMINYFSYDYPKPTSENAPFTMVTDITNSPWNRDSQLLRIGLTGFTQEVAQLPHSNIVFLVDTSGSMGDENKLPLVKKSLALLADNLRPEDKISLVTYAGYTQVVLSSISGAEKHTIQQAINYLGSGGSTAGESGLKLAYQQAEAGFIKGGNNRIIMMTDGDLNVGLSGVNKMVELVKTKRKNGVYLSTVGFGSGNYREDMMEQIANHGNGIYFYIDSYQEAVKVFERNLRSNLFTLAKDVKIQIEFNPAVVSEYRLVGYENRKLNREDFNNDKVDAGDVGQGHSVTALYEITYQGDLGKIDSSRYTASDKANNKHANEVAFIKLRYKPNGSEKSLLMENKLTKESIEYKDTDLSFKKAIMAASFGELLRESKYIERKFNYFHLLKMISDLEVTDKEINELEDLILLARLLNRNN
ncbi:MAG: VWA domain-containing protein [Kangiellaceae bacterium]